MWSNCLAGWLITNGQLDKAILLVCLGGSFLYVGGMFLNDAFDVAFDRQYRPERPIPSGLISERLVWVLGWSWLGLGLICFLPFGLTSLLSALALAGTIVLYDATHKKTAVAPLFMATCRLLLYVLAGTAAGGLTKQGVAAGLALGCYIAGLSYLAKKESIPGPLKHWPASLLFAPLFFMFWRIGLFDSFLRLLVILAFLVWIVSALRLVYRFKPPRIGQAIARLLAGIVLVDALAVPMLEGFAFSLLLILFLLALIMQRIAPAT